MTQSQSNLELLNSFRQAEGKAPFADWRKARHQPMLDAYMANAETAAVERGELAEEDTMDFEAPADELAQQEGRPSNDEQPEQEPEQEEAAPVAQSLSAAAAKNEVVRTAQKAKLPTYKEMAINNYRDSSVEKPVAFVHQFCENHPELTRKQAIAALLAYGVNYSTARTQYQKWYAAHKQAK